jgi:predicted dehydrogenase
MTSPIPSLIDRRTFVKNASIAGLSLAALGPTLSAANAASSSSAAGRRKRYAIVGTGSRHYMYLDAITQDYAEHAELVGLCDTNPGRLALSQTRAKANGATPPPAFAAADFDRMLSETKPDVVIVTTMDSTHDDYIVHALQAGHDVITEKPMTTTADKCQRILDAKKSSDRNLRVTFNYRYSPPRTQVKDLLMSGEIGDVLSVDFHWMLNTHHGADYFRRWHGEKKNSGGLMVHKSTHHFDLVNWWLGAMPETVMATGKRDFYTPAMAKRFGLESHHERCHTCPEKDKCGFFFSLADQPPLKALYLDQEKHDGYFRDQCVWNPRIDIEDTMNVLVNYDNGVTLAYSLNAFNAWEGYTIVFNGTLGRIEHTIVEQVYVNGTDTVQGGIAAGGVTTKIFPLRGEPREVEPWTGTGGHGGGDKVMLDEIFLPNAPADKYKRASDERGGAASILVGIAANRCFETKQPVKIADLVSGLTAPDFAPMPSHTTPLPMPPKMRRRA